MLTIRFGTATEHKQLEQLQRRASLANVELRGVLEANPDAIALDIEQLQQGQVLVAEIDGRLAGFAAVVGSELDGLFVEPELWRRGVGAALIREAVHRARRQGSALMVIANPAARTFYEKCGFSVEGEVPTRFGPALRMSR